MFNSEKAELAIARRERIITPKNKLSSLIVVDPSYASFDGLESQGKQSLSYYGEFMLTEGLIDQVIVVQRGVTWPVPEHAVPDMFLDYLNLWTEVNAGKAVTYVFYNDGMDLDIAHNDHIYLCMGGSSKETKRLVSLVVSHLLDTPDVKISMIPPSVAVSIAGQPTGDRFVIFDINKEANMKGHLYDSGFSFSNYKNEYPKRVHKGPSLPVKFPSFTGKFFQHGRAVNPLGSKIESLMQCRGFMGHDYGGANPYVYFDNKDRKTQMRPGETTIQALLRIAPELAKTNEGITVAYRGYVDNDRNTLDSWQEAVVFVRTKGGQFVGVVPTNHSGKSDVKVIDTPLVPIGSSHYKNLADFRSHPDYPKTDWGQIFSSTNGWFLDKDASVSYASLMNFINKHNNIRSYPILVELAKVVEREGGFRVNGL